MLMTSAVLFALAALGGLMLAGQHFRGRTPPSGAIALVHGGAAATALVLLLLAVLQIGVQGPAAWSLGLFLLAALGGFALVSFHLRGRALPSAMVLGHGVFAVLAFLVLLYALFARPGG